MSHSASKTRSLVRSRGAPWSLVAPRGALDGGVRTPYLGAYNARDTDRLVTSTERSPRCGRAPGAALRAPLGFAPRQALRGARLRCSGGAAEGAVSGDAARELCLDVLRAARFALGGACGGSGPRTQHECVLADQPLELPMGLMPNRPLADIESTLQRPRNDRIGLRVRSQNDPKMPPTLTSKHLQPKSTPKLPPPRAQTDFTADRPHHRRQSIPHRLPSTAL